MATPALARERLFALREAIARIENGDGPGLARRKRWQWDADGPPEAAASASSPAETTGLEAVFDDGLPACGLVEIRNAQTRDMGAATGFTLALAALRQQQADGSAGATL